MIIHLVASVSEESRQKGPKGKKVKVTTRHIRTRCGIEMDPQIEGDSPGPLIDCGAVVWNSQVTCPICKAPVG